MKQAPSQCSRLDPRRRTGVCLKSLYPAQNSIPNVALLRLLKQPGRRDHLHIASATRTDLVSEGHMLNVDSPPTVGQTWMDLTTISVAFLIAHDHEKFMKENYQLEQFRHVPEALCRMRSESRNVYAIRNRDFRDQPLLLKDGYLAFRDRERIKRIKDNSLLSCWSRRA